MEKYKKELKDQLRNDVNHLIYLATHKPQEFANELKIIKDQEYKNGKKKAVEMAVKDYKEKYSLNFPGRTLEDLLDAHAKKVLSYVKKEKA